MEKIEELLEDIDFLIRENDVAAEKQDNNAYIVGISVGLKMARFSTERFLLADEE